MPSSLKLVRKVRVFEKVPRSGIIPYPPLVGERSVVCRAERRLMAVLDRDSLDVVHRYDSPEMFPLHWLGPERLLMGGASVGVWDTTEERYVWRADQGGGSFPWRDRLVTFASDSELEIRRVTGEIERSLNLGIPATGYGTPCGDFYVFPTPDDRLHTCDPIRAVQMTDGSVQWSRNLLAEFRQRRPAVDPWPVAVITRASMPDRCIITREGIMAACSLVDGAILWMVDVQVPSYWPRIVDGRIPVLCRGRFTVTDEATGAMLVDRRHPELSEMYQEWSGTVLGDLAIFSSQSTHLAALDLRTGDLVYVKHHKRVAFWGTAVADGRLLASGTDGNIWVYEAA